MKQLLKCFKLFLGLGLFLLGFSLSQTILAKEEASFFLSPSSGTYQVDEEFQVELKVNASEAITSLKAYLDFDPSVISVSKIETEDNIFPYWWEKESQAGKVQLQASSPSPGFKGENALVAKITFKAINNGTVKIGYNSESLALTLDDKNILNLDKSVQAEFNIEGTPLAPTSGSSIIPKIPALVALVLLVAALAVIFRKNIMRVFQG